MRQCLTPSIALTSCLIERVFWGDLHSHARRSFDATGDLPFHYARDVARLDFYALTDHVEQLSDEMWEEIRLASSRLV